MPEQNPIDVLQDMRDTMDNPEVLDLEIRKIIERVSNQETVFWTGGTSFQGWTNIKDLTDFYVEDPTEVPDIHAFIAILNSVGNPGLVISEFEFSVYNAQHELSFMFKDTPIVWDEDSKKWVTT